MQIKISPEAAKFIQAGIDSGLYSDAGQFISDIVIKYESWYNNKLDKLNAELAPALEQARNGELSEFNFDEIMS